MTKPVPRNRGTDQKKVLSPNHRWGTGNKTDVPPFYGTIFVPQTRGAKPKNTYSVLVSTVCLPS